MSAKRFDGDSGAILVEFALLAPIMVLLSMGLLEFGLTLRESQRGAAAVQVAARAAANTPGSGDGLTTWTPRRQGPLTDYNAINAITAAMPDPALINRVVIFQAGSSGTVPATCTTMSIPSGYGGTSTCNVYSGDWIANTFNSATWAQFAGTTTDATTGDQVPVAACGTGVDSTFCPENRQASGDAAAWVGVWMEYRRDTTTGMFGSSFTMSETAVYRIEPVAGS
jgi:Flp pilus assembly protein TadG